jgi:AcrR family transcriptional regulator
VTRAVPLDRRQRRRQETIEEVLDVAAAVMAEQGVAGLTLGEVARRMGIRPPSLYVYFDGKHALYDALFARGWRLLDADLRVALAALDDLAPDARLHAVSAAFTRWMVEHPGYAPLMMWRPVPGFLPSAEAYAPAIESAAAGRAMIERARDDGLLRPDLDVDRAYRAWTALISGVVSQQLANEPDASFETGRFTGILADLTDMWLTRWRADPAPPGGVPAPPTSPRAQEEQEEER